jgi:hypothetical protein
VASSHFTAGARRFGAGLAALLLGSSMVVTAAPAGSVLAASPDGVGPVEVTGALHHDVSAPLSVMAAAAARAEGTHGPQPQTDRPLRSIPHGNPNQPDGALQGTAGATPATTPGLGFPGVGNGDYGFSPNAAPPDTNGAVGTTQYVQWVNESFAVFSKTGSLQLGPVAGNTLWSNFPDNCATHNDGDPIVQFDKVAKRWVMTQFVVSTTPYEQCVAVSTTDDATGTWNRYSFSYGNTDFNDYPKLGVWPDPSNNAYFISYNIFANGTSFSGAKVCAFDRNAMMNGTAATQQCFQLSTAYGGLLPADLDGQTLPPTGSPGMFVNFTSNTLNLWRFKVDWSNAANTALAGPFSIPGVASFTAACNGGTCIPQPGVSQQLDSLADRLMYRLAYRNFGDHEALVVDHSVAAGSSVGVRWYEIRNVANTTMATTTPYVFQQGTYAPDATYRWMGSIAMDRNGDIAVGYSGSSSSVYPYVAYATRVPSDTLDTLSAETIAKAGGGSQYCPNRLYCRSLSRWGDYSAMSVDPVDDCTFWYTNEYEKTSGAFNWSTWITSFKFPGCSSTQTLTSISVAPAAASVTVGGTQQFTATALDQQGLPMATQPQFTWAVSGGGSIDQTGLFSATTVGTGFTVTASSGGTNGTASVDVTAAPDFSLSATPGSQSVRRGGTVSYTITITPINGFTGSVTLSASGAPGGAQVTFTPNPATTGATLTVATRPNTSPKTYTLTITGVSGTLSHTATVSLTVTK